MNCFGHRHSMGDEGQSFARLEEIENGTLVHYLVAVKYKMPSQVFEPLEGETWKRGESAHEVSTSQWRTVYCKDVKELILAVETAHRAFKEIERLAIQSGGSSGMAFIGPA